MMSTNCEHKDPEIRGVFRFEKRLTRQSDLSRGALPSQVQTADLIISRAKGKQTAPTFISLRDLRQTQKRARLPFNGIIPLKGSK